MPTAVVIGTGAGGLTSALLLASHGYRVRVFERHYRPGGFLHRFFRAGIPYDTGFHYCGGVGRDDIFGRVLRHLQVFDNVEFLPMDPDGFDRLLFPGFEFRVPVGAERYRERLKERFPHEAAGIDAFVDAIQESVSRYGLYSLSFDVDVEHFLKWEKLTLWEFIEHHIVDPRLRAVLCGQATLYGVTPHEAPFGIHALVLDHFLRGAHRIRGGGDRLAMAMVRRIRSLGGEVRLKSKVTGILVDDNRVVTVIRLESGETVTADVVISNVHPRLTVDLLPEGAVRPANRNRVRNNRVAVAHLGVYIETEGPVVSMGNANVYRHPSLDVTAQFQSSHLAADPFYFATAPNPVRGGAAGKRGVLLMLAPLDWESVSRWEGIHPRPDAYEAFKAQASDRLVEALLRDFPDIQIRHVEASTPLSTRDFTGSPEGAMYGHYHSVSQMGRYRPAQVTRVRNLLMVGHGVFAPGILGATLSAYYACSWLIGQDVLLREILEA